MPGYIQIVDPGGVMPCTLCAAFSESRLAKTFLRIKNCAPEQTSMGKSERGSERIVRHSYKGAGRTIKQPSGLRIRHYENIAPL
jgi:hypothetical protein